MYISQHQLRSLVENYGTPKEYEWEQAISPEEMQIVLDSGKFGRAHDVTFFIFDGFDRLALIRKPFFPPGVYRAPSGGVRPGEDFEQGVLREAYEETGLKIRLERYLVRIRVRFSCGDTIRPWTSHVFSAQRLSGELRPIDRKEISEAIYCTIEELQNTIRDKLLLTGKGLFRYRVRLTDAAVEAIKESRGSVFT